MGVTGSWCPRSLVGRAQSRQMPPWLDEDSLSNAASNYTP